MKGAICLTGDVHHKSMKTREQSETQLSEVRIAEEYLAVAEKHGVRVTLFVTGKIFEEELDDVKTLLRYKNLEIGGHTFSALRPLILHSLFRRLGFSYYGPKYFQDRDLKKTIGIIKEKVGRTITSWRTHAYASNSNTYPILQKYGIKIISEEIRKNQFLPYKRNGLTFLPINTIPNHEHIFHGCRTHQAVSDLQLAGWADDFGSESYTVEEWFKFVQQQTERIIDSSGVATILAHPLCMEISDRLKTFTKLCKALSRYNSIFATEADRFLE